VTAADRPVQRPTDAKLLAIGADGGFQHLSRETFVSLLRHDDLVVANDAATLPASLRGVHVPSGEPIEVRLAGWHSGTWHDASRFSAVVFGSGDYRTRTEHRPLPPPLFPGDPLVLGPLFATVTNSLGHPRLVSLRFKGTDDAIWEGLAHHGHPIQYAHMATPLALWDVWTAAAAIPAAFEPPSAGFVLSWNMLAQMRSRGVAFVTITHAAGLSSTGDEELDTRLPLDEPYEIPTAAAQAIANARGRGGRVVAIGTTVVRALEHSASGGGTVRPGSGVATQRINGASRLAVTDAILSGIHEPGTSHYDLLRAFTDDSTLCRATETMRSRGYRTHEFGDSVLIEARE
jgi:S-adenosylmethionine:tRNA ribosyltransferase-isomerase